jgi:xanthine/uracil permease
MGARSPLKAGLSKVWVYMIGVLLLLLLIYVPLVKALFRSIPLLILGGTLLLLLLLGPLTRSKRGE